MKTLTFLAGLLAFLVWVSPHKALGAEVGVTNYITQVSSYSDFGGGDVIVYISGIPGCEGGVWLRPTDGGFKSNVAMITMAYLYGKMINVTASDSARWPGSSSNFCHLYSVSF